MKFLASLLILILFPLLLSAQLDTAHLEPSASLGGSGKAAPYIPSSGHMPDRHFVSGNDIKSRFAGRSTSNAGTVPDANADGSADWIAEAVHYYPELSVKDSSLNKAFLSLYQRTKATKPELLTKSHWPLGLAIAARAMLDTNTSTLHDASVQLEPTPNKIKAIGQPQVKSSVMPIQVGVPGIPSVLSMPNSVPKSIVSNNPVYSNAPAASNNPPKIGSLTHVVTDDSYSTTASREAKTSDPSPASSTQYADTPTVEDTSPTGPEHILQPEDTTEVYKGIRDASLQQNNGQSSGNTPANDTEDASNSPEHIITTDDVKDIYKGVHDLSLQRNNIQVGGYRRANGTEVASYERMPPGGYSFDQQLKANQDALIASCVALGIDWCYGKYEDWAKKKEQEKESKQK